MDKKLCVLGLVLVGGVAHADKPAWCPEHAAGLKGTPRMARPENDVEQRLAGVVFGKCNPRTAQGEEGAVVDAAYAELSKGLELTDADWADVMQFTEQPRSAEIRVADHKVAWTARDPVDQYATFQRPFMEVPGLGASLDIWYLGDIYGAQLSQSGHLAIAEKCLEKENAPVVWAMCQGDIDALDFKQLSAELRADKSHDGFGKTTVRVAMYKVKNGLPAHAEAVAKLAAKDPAFKQLFELGATERKAWASRYNDNKELVDLARAMDEALVTNSRKASAGCAPKAWELLAKAISHIPAKSLIAHRKEGEPDDILYADEVLEVLRNAIVAEPEGYLAAAAYATCHKLEKTNDKLAELLEPKLHHTIGFRGPRTGTAMRIALADLQFDDRATRIDFPDSQRYWWIGNSGAGVGIGTVASVKAKGDKATVAFQQKLEKAYYDVGCKQGRLQGWRNDGSPQYELNCAGTKSYNIDRRPSPIEVDARYTTNVKPGMPIAFTEGMVIEAWSKAEGGAPATVLGQPVK